MAWETRGTHGRTYYYSARRQGGRVLKAYHGSGVVGALAADAVEQARRERSQEAEALRADVARLDGPERALDALDQACTLMLKAELTAAGYRRTNYGPWRRRRWPRPTN